MLFLDKSQSCYISIYYHHYYYYYCHWARRVRVVPWQITLSIQKLQYPSKSNLRQKIQKIHKFLKTAGLLLKKMYCRKFKLVSFVSWIIVFTDFSSRFLKRANMATKKYKPVLVRPTYSVEPEIDNSDVNIIVKDYDLLMMYDWLQWIDTGRKEHLTESCYAIYIIRKIPFKKYPYKTFIDIDTRWGINCKRLKRYWEHIDSWKRRAAIQFDSFFHSIFFNFQA